MIWTDERVELLRRLWQEGHTASQIATKLSLGVTRNAVIGKVHRLGLAARAPSPNPSPRVEPKAQSRQTPTPPRPVTKIVRGNTALAPVQLVEQHEDALPTPMHDAKTNVVPIRERVTLMDLREATCRWPIGDPLSPDFHFCGARSPIGVAYCESHAQIAYQPTHDRRRDRDKS